MAIALLALYGSDSAPAPKNIFAFGVRIMRAARVVVRLDDAAASKVETIQKHKAAHDGNLLMNVEGNRLARMNRQFGHFVSSNGRSIAIVANFFQRRGINDFV